MAIILLLCLHSQYAAKNPDKPDGIQLLINGEHCLLIVTTNCPTEAGVQIYRNCPRLNAKLPMNALKYHIEWNMFILMLSCWERWKPRQQLYEFGGR